MEQLDLPVIKTSVQVSMASQSHSNSVSGYCVSGISISDRLYKQVKLFVLENLCTDIILGLDFQMVHQYVQFNFGGKEPPMNVCLLEMSGITPPSLFPKLSPDCQPIATKSRKYSSADKSFIKQEVQRLFPKVLLRGRIPVARSSGCDR